jgi:hypothetical protein
MINSRFRSKVLIITILLILLGLVLFLPTWSTPQIQAQGGLRYSEWSVTIQGESNDQVFQREGRLIVTQSPISTAGTTNEANQFELFLISGNPTTSPQSGAIWFMTNNAMIGSRAQIDLAFVTFNAQTNTITVKPDPRLSAVGPNGFNSHSGLLANLYQIFDGSMQIQSQDNFKTVSGTINILGTGAIFHSNTQYIAQISGTFLGEGVL